MSTITRERLEPVIERLEHYATNVKWTSVQAAQDMLIAVDALRIVLASLEAEVVAMRDERSGSGGICKQPGFNDLPHGTPLYTAPPAPVNAEPVAWLWSNRKHPSEVTFISPEDDEKAEAAQWSGWIYKALYAEPPVPVSVPEPIKRNDADGWWMYKGRRVGGGCAEWYNLALDDCRAAMLQGADGNYPVIPDGYALVPVDPTLEMVKAGANAASTGMLIPGMYRAMLAAAPQQEE